MHLLNKWIQKCIYNIWEDYEILKKIFLNFSCLEMLWFIQQNIISPALIKIIFIFLRLTQKVFQDFTNPKVIIMDYDNFVKSQF